MNTHAIILARSGSKGIKNKNIIKFNNKALIEWTIKSCLTSKYIDKVWISSDSEKILQFSEKNNIGRIPRPKKYSQDHSSSEESLLHAIKYLKNLNYKIDTIVMPQVTSPIREKKDFDKALKFFKKNKLDSLFSSCEAPDYFIWNSKNLKPNYNLSKRPRRQDKEKKIIENGSFYIFNCEKFLKKKIRLFGKIGNFNQDKFKSFQIDDMDDLKICETIFKSFCNKKS